jgi:hypothetical protein
MSRTRWNTVVDAVAYFGSVLLASTGLMLRFQLPSGSGGLHGIGSGPGAGDRPVTIVWGLSRHEWGNIHYWIALFLMGVLAVHLILHWKWIVSILGKKAHPDVSGARFMLGIAGLILVSLLAAAPLLTPTETTPRSELLEDRSEFNHGDSESVDEKGESLETRGIQGFMTLEEVATLSGIPASDILDRLDLPPDTKPSEKVGRLLKSHGLEMSSLRQAVGQDEAAR